MSLNTYKNILKGGIFLSLLALLFTFKGLLFPYITSKQISFNIIIELLTAVWLIFLIQYPEYRPKFNYVTFGLAAFLAALLISSIFGVDFNLSFWGDVERMLGWFHLFHFFLFYLIIVTVFRSWEDYRKLFMAFFGLAVVISLYGIGQKIGIVKSPMGADRIISTIGNAAYVGSFAIFSIYFTLFLIVKEENPVMKIVYWIGAFIMLLALIYSGTRGAYFGFAAGLIVALFMFGAFGQDKKLKKISFGSLALLILFLVLVFSFRNSNFVHSNAFLQRITSSRLSDATLQTRFISWKAALDDFPHHPILGTGYGNFAVTFDKYFDPKFYNYTKSETYFDRAHNNLIDMTSTSGLLGVLAYLSIFAASAFYLIRGFRRKEVGLTDFTLIGTLILAYFVQNLFVFDALATYIPLMIMLAYIVYLTGGGEEEPAISGKRELTGKKLGASVIVVILSLTVVYKYNVQVLKMLVHTIDGQYVLAADKDLIAAEADYKTALSYGTPLDRDSRSSFVRSVSENFSLLDKMDPNQRAEMLDYAISLAEANVKLNPADSMNQMILAQILYITSSYNQSNIGKFNYYSGRAEEAINKSIASSPRRVPIYFEKAQIYLSRNDVDSALKTLQYAISLNTDYPDGYCHLSRLYSFKKDEAKSYENMDRCLDLGGAGNLNSEQYVLSLIGHYEKSKDIKRLISLVEHLTVLSDKNADYWIELAKLYVQDNNKEYAISSARKAAEADPSLKTAAEQFIQQIGQ